MGVRQRVLFLCTHNSAGSQMAEGLLRHLGGDRFQAFSASTEATQVRPLAVRAMRELGIDISGQESKTLDRYVEQPFEKVSRCVTRPTRPVRSSSAPGSGCTGASQIRARPAAPEDEQLAVY